MFSFLVHFTSFLFSDRARNTKKGKSNIKVRIFLLKCEVGTSQYFRDLLRTKGTVFSRSMMHFFDLNYGELQSILALGFLCCPEFLTCSIVGASTLSVTCRVKFETELAALLTAWQ